MLKHFLEVCYNITYYYKFQTQKQSFVHRFIYSIRNLNLRKRVSRRC